MKARDIMRGNIHTVSPDDDCLAVGEFMINEGYSSVAVMDGGEFKGMLSKESFLESLEELGTQPLHEIRVGDHVKESYERVKASDELDKVVYKLLYVPQRIERLPVFEDDKLVGLISKGHVVKLFSQECKGKFEVEDLMEYKPMIVHDYTPLEKVVRKVRESTEKKVLVCSGEKVVGVVTVVDLSLALFKKKKENPDADAFQDVAASDVMSAKVIEAGKSEDAAEAAGVMVSEGIGILPVCEKDKLEGVLTKTDIVKGYDIVLKKI